MRVLLLRSLGGHPARTVVDQDQAAAEWLLSVGFAIAADDETEPANDESGSAEATPEAPAEPVTSTNAPRVRRSPRAATPGG